MSQNAIITLVALALIGACALFALSTATHKEPAATAAPEPDPEPAEPDAVPEPVVRTPAKDGRRDARRDRRAARRALLEQRAATRRAEREAYAAKRAAERRAFRARPLAELDPFPPTPPATPSPNGGGATPTDGLGPAVAFEIAPRAEREAVASLGPAVQRPAPLGPWEPAPSELVAASAATQVGAASRVTTANRPRIFTGEPVELEPREQPTRRALKLLGGMTALAAVGAVGILALARAIAAMFGR